MMFLFGAFVGVVVLTMSLLLIFFFFNHTATTEIYTLSLHDALPIYDYRQWCPQRGTLKSRFSMPEFRKFRSCGIRDRKSTRLNSSHTVISYAVFCLKKKKNRDYGDEMSSGVKEELYGGGTSFNGDGR